MRHALLAAAAFAVCVAPSAALAQSTPALPRSALSTTIPEPQEDAALQAAVASTTRPEADRARDPWRHPYEALTFWGLAPGMTVVEIEPGGASWWRHILEPYAAATGGRYVPVNRPLESMGVEPGTADFILVARAFHNWSRGGRTEPYLAAFFQALKPGGVLAVEEHRSDPTRAQVPGASDGYVATDFVIATAEKAGFKLDAKSEINANPKDTKDHPFGVWTLPPVRRSPAADKPDPSFDRAKYDAIGESDRMTLRFVKQ